MCLFSVKMSSEGGLPPAKKPDPNIDTTIKEGKKLTDEDEVTKVDYGDEADTEEQRKKRKGAEDLSIQLQADEKKTGGIGGIG